MGSIFSTDEKKDDKDDVKKLDDTSDDDKDVMNGEDVKNLLEGTSDEKNSLTSLGIGNFDGDSTTSDITGKTETQDGGSAHNFDSVMDLKKFIIAQKRDNPNINLSKMRFNKYDIFRVLKQLDPEFQQGGSNNSEIQSELSDAQSINNIKQVIAKEISKIKEEHVGGGCDCEGNKKKENKQKGGGVYYNPKVAKDSSSSSISSSDDDDEKKINKSSSSSVSSSSSISKKKSKKHVPEKIQQIKSSDTVQYEESDTIGNTESSESGKYKKPKPKSKSKSKSKVNKFISSDTNTDNNNSNFIINESSESSKINLSDDDSDSNDVKETSNGNSDEFGSAKKLNTKKTSAKKNKSKKSKKINKYNEDNDEDDDEHDDNKFSSATGEEGFNFSIFPFDTSNIESSDSKSSLSARNYRTVRRKI